MFKKRTKATTLILILLGLLFVAQGVFAANGKITGYVRDSKTDNPLVGANVIFKDTNIGTYTSRTGHFRFVGLESGSYMIEVSYLGYESFSQEIQVDDNTSETLSIELEASAIEGSEVVFVGVQRVGQTQALNQQRTADNITNVIASEQIQTFPDRNVAESLQRIPSVNLQRDQGEGRYITIRGTEPNLNTVMINGSRIPAPEGEVRSVALDVIPANALAKIEVHKALSPDMDGDAIGGAVNLVTRSALDFTEAKGHLNLSGGYNAISSNPLGQGSISYGTQMGAEKNIGIQVNASYYASMLGSDNNEMEYEDEDVIDRATGEENEEYVLTDIQLRDYTITRTRASVGTNFDYILNENHKMYARALWNQFGDQEHRRRLRFRPGKGDMFNDNIAEDAAIERELKDRYEVQRVFNIDFGGESHLMDGLLDVDYDISYSYAEEEEPERKDYTFEYEDDVTFEVNNSDPDVPGINPISVSADDINNPEHWLLDEIAYEDNLTTDDELAIKADFKYHLNIPNVSWVKAGFKTRMKSKDRENHVMAYKPEDDVLLSQFNSKDFDSKDFLGGDYDQWNTGLSPEPDKASDWFDQYKNDASVLEGEENIEDSKGASYEATENVNAAFLMGKAKFGKEWSLTAGVRMETTDIEYEGYKVHFIDTDGDEENDDVTVEKTKGSNDYVNVLPSLHLRYKANPKTNVRASFTQSMSRPKYFDLVPYTIRNREDEEIKIGNPELDAAFANNLDLMVEHYFQSVGVVSFGFFSKSIDNYVYDSVTDQIFDENGDDVEYKVTQPVNADDAANLYGFEINLNQQLTMLPGFANGFGIYLNYTYIDSKIDFLLEDGSKRESVIPGMSENSGNFAISYEKFGFSGRLSLNLRGKQILEVGEDSKYDTWLDDRMQVDLKVSQRVWNTMRVYADFLNLTNAPYVVYKGDDDHPIQREYYNWSMQMGISFEF